MDQVDEIKKRIDIVEFIGQYLQLKKAGVNHSALCPFHSEKTPSFMVSPERQSFKCFGCGEGGDVITFFMKMEGLTFSEALRILGERVGVQVSLKPKEEADREKTRRDRILKINLLAAKYYKMVLNAGDGSPAREPSPSGAAALKYLEGRGLSQKTIEKLKIGYAPSAPPAGGALEKYLSKYGFSFSEVALAGHPERFRYRIIFPIFDVLGHVIGFSGRIFESDLPEGVSAHPKYLNTPETPVFHKSRALYGLNLAKDAIRKNKRVVVVEGQMDVAACHEAGIEEAVASSGTALTRDHLKILGRYSSNIIFAFDEDEAGQKAAHSAVEMAFDEELEPRLTIIEKYKDIGELVEKEPKKLEGIISGALAPVEWLVKKAGDKLVNAQEKKALAGQAVKFISHMKDEIEKAHYIGHLAKVLGVPEVSIEKAMARKQVASSKEQADMEERPNTNLEEEFLAFLIGYPGEAKAGPYLIHAELQHSDLYKKICDCYNSSKVQSCISETLEELDRTLEEKLDSLVLLWDKRISEDKEAALQEFADLSRKLAETEREKLKSSFARRIAEAESQGNIEEVKKLMIELQNELKGDHGEESH